MRKPSLLVAVLAATVCLAPPALADRFSQAVSQILAQPFGAPSSAQTADLGSPTRA